MRNMPISAGDAGSIDVGDILVDEGGRRFKVTGLSQNGGWMSVMEWNWRTRLKEWILDRVRDVRLRSGSWPS